jgi:hypothetical protein
LLQDNPRLPLFFFGHGRSPLGGANFRILGQPDHNSSREAVLFERGKDDELFRGRLVYAVGFQSASLMDKVTADELRGTLIGFADNILVSWSHQA